MTKFSFLALLPFAVSFDLHEHPIVETVLSDLREGWSEFGSLFALQSHELPLHSAVPNNADTCSACSQGGTKFLMEHAMKMMQGKCANASANSCVFGEICRWSSKHPKVAMGMMLEHLRPMSLMQAYCTGKGSCERFCFTMNEILSGSQPHEALLNNFDKIDWSNVIEEASDLVPQKPEQDKEADEEETPKCKTDSKVCPHCMKKEMRKVTKHAIMKVKAMCQDTKCPVMLKMCPWMHENREVSLGMLISKVAPWKFAKGWCLHKAKRNHGRGKFGDGPHEFGKFKGKGKGKWHHGPPPPEIDEWHHGHHHHDEGHRGHHHHDENHHGHHHHDEWHRGHHHHDENHHGHHHHEEEHHGHHDHGFKGGFQGYMQKMKDEGETLIAV